jgi:uridine kinase
MPQRQAILRMVADAILRLPANPIVRVGVDGVDGAGKTVFGDQLAQILASDRAIIRASVDAFHHPRALRYRRGRDSPDGYFYDSYNYARLREVLLDPLSPGGSGRYRIAAFDYRTDQPVASPEAQAGPGAILIFDGIFLHRPELRSYWDFSILLEVGFDISIPRGAARDGTSPDLQAPENRRYVEGQQLYFSTCEPSRHATVAINNEVLESPYIVRVS